MHAARSNIGAYVKNVVGLEPASNAGTTRNGPAIDRTGYQSCAILGHIGAIAGAPTATSAVYKLQDSEDGTTFADYGTAAAAITAASTGAEKDIDLGSARKFIRVVETVTFTGGTSPTAQGAASVTLGGSADLPV